MPSIKINQQVLDFNNIYYVDSTKGLDTNDGSKSSPFATVNYAVSKCATTGDAVFALAGTHDVTRIAGAYDSGGLWDENKNISFFGLNEKTIFLCDGRNHSGRDTHCIMFQNAETKAYNIIFDFKVGNRNGSNYQNAICGIGGGAVKGEIVNCLFKIDSLIPNFTYSNSGTTTTKFTNCVFDVKANFVGSYSGQGFTIENCATNFNFHSEGTRNNIYSKVTFDSNYHITNYDELILNIGVYAGSSPWSTYWSIISMLLQSNNKLYSIIREPQYNLAKEVARVTASGGSYPERTIDGNIASYWYSSNLNSAWILYEFKERILIDTIDICSFYQSGYEGIKNFTVEASNTGMFNGEQKLLYKGMHPNDTTNSFITYSFNNYRSYKFYRIHVKDIYYGNGGGNLSIHEVQFWNKSTSLIEIPNESLNNFVKYGVSPPIHTNFTTGRKSFVLQDGVSNDNQGYLTKNLNPKPLSIYFI